MIPNFPVYTKAEFLHGKEEGKNRVYMKEEDYDTLVGLIRYKKNVILQGAPGVGKTFAAKRLAYSMIGRRIKSSDAGAVSSELFL